MAQAQVDNLAAELAQLRHLVGKYAGMATHEVIVLTPSVGPLIGATLKFTTNPGLIPAGAVGFGMDNFEVAWTMAAASPEYLKISKQELLDSDLTMSVETVTARPDGFSLFAAFHRGAQPAQGAPASSYGETPPTRHALSLMTTAVHTVLHNPSNSHIWPAITTMEELKDWASSASSGLAALPSSPLTIRPFDVPVDESVSRSIRLCLFVALIPAAARGRWGHPDLTFERATEIVSWVDGNTPCPEIPLPGRFPAELVEALDAVASSAAVVASLPTRLAGPLAAEAAGAARIVTPFITYLSGRIRQALLTKRSEDIIKAVRSAIGSWRRLLTTGSFFHAEEDKTTSVPDGVRPPAPQMWTDLDSLATASTREAPRFDAKRPAAAGGEAKRARGASKPRGGLGAAAAASSSSSSGAAAASAPQSSKSSKSSSSSK
jgi:hypothetical protein